MFKNKVVIVTGASSGIGATTAEMFAKEGASVAIVARNEAKLNEVKKRCEKLGAKALVIKADITKDEEAKTIVEKTVNTFGKLDVLVNNAAAQKVVGLFEDGIMETFDNEIKANLRSVILITKLASPFLIKSKGNVVNVSSAASKAIQGQLKGITSYAISKAGMDLYAQAAALEFAKSGVRYNTVNPGPVKTGLLDAYADMKTEALDDMMSQITALGRASDPEEIGDMILYLASDKARGITGSCFVVDNGFLLSC